MDLCPYCRVKIDNFQKKEHLRIHKTLKHKELPVQFQSASLFLYENTSDNDNDNNNNNNNNNDNNNNKLSED